jgi:CBS domain-containing protein
MHGVRALALERRLPETGTVPRIRRLAEAGLFDKPYAQQLTDAFGFLLGLRLSHGLECLRLHRPPDNLVSLADLTKLERDLLKESLRIVRGFRELVRHHFRLGMF